MKTSSPSNTTITPGNFRYLRRLCGLGIAAIGLAAPLASANTIPVANGNFETEYGSNTNKTTNWVKLTSWSLENTTTGSLLNSTGGFSPDPDGGTHFTRFTWNDAGAEQDLNTNVAVGDTLSVTFNFGRATNRWGGSNNTGVAYFKIGSQFYTQTCDVSSQTAGTWKSFTFTTTATNAGALILGFRVAPSSNNQYVSLDGVSDVTLTPAANDPNAPTSTNATLAADENVPKTLTESDFGYADPNSSPLANVQITSLPALGTLKNGGATVVIGELPLTVAAANIGNLTYLSPLVGFGNNYTTIGIKVQNSATPTGLWSLPAIMTVNVTHVNHAPTSTGGAAIMSVRTATSMPFAASNFQFSDVDAGNTLQAIKVKSSPLHGTLSVAVDTEIPVANIGTLTYTPTPGYTGTDSFDFQVSDGALFSANATMAISDTTDILVQDGSFETPGVVNPYNTVSWAGVAAPWTHSEGVWGQVKRAATTLPDNGGGTWVANINDAATTVISQPLGSYSFIEGDTLTVTFDVGRTNYGGGIFEALFRVNGVALSPQSYNNTTQTVNTWATDTLTTIIPSAVTDGALTLEFRWLSGRVGNLDKVSNVSVGHVGVDPNAPTSTGATLAALENTATALAAGDFGYANTAHPASLLAAVQITELPALGTLKYISTATPVAKDDIILAADIGNLSYLSPLHGFGTPYET
ncbi:MAG: Ig-like domain-containing protein, partial [Verrucomicrobiota bacterium]